MVYNFAIGEITRKGKEIRVVVEVSLTRVRTYSSSSRLYFLPSHHSKLFNCILTLDQVSCISFEQFRS